MASGFGLERCLWLELSEPPRVSLLVLGVSLLSTPSVGSLCAIMRSSAGAAHVPASGSLLPASAPPFAAPILVFLVSRYCSLSENNSVVRTWSKHVLSISLHLRTLGVREGFPGGVLDE